MLYLITLLFNHVFSCRQCSTWTKDSDTAGAALDWLSGSEHGHFGIGCLSPVLARLEMHRLVTRNNWLSQCLTARLVFDSAPRRKLRVARIVAWPGFVVFARVVFDSSEISEFFVFFFPWFNIQAIHHRRLMSHPVAVSGEEEKLNMIYLLLRLRLFLEMFRH